MPGGFILCEYDDVKTSGFTEYKELLETLEAKLMAKAQQDWYPTQFGGMNPTAGQFGKGTVMPQLFVNLQATTLVTWTQWFNAIGAQLIMQGANAGRIYEDYKVGVAGLAFLDKAIKVSEIKMQIGDKKLPRINIEEMRCYKKPAIIFEDAYIVDEETGFDLRAFIEAQGEQTIKLIGVQANRIPDKLFTTATGAALT